MENNFENHIKGAMDNPPEFPFDEMLWKDMESRLDKDSKQKPFLGFIGRWPLLLLALFAAILAGYFYSKQYKAMERLDAMEQQLRIQQNTKTNPSVEKHVTVIYDTIYNKIVVDQLSQQKRRQNTVQNGRSVHDNQHQFALDFDFEALSGVFNATNTQKSNWSGSTQNDRRLSWIFANNPNNYPSGYSLGLSSPSNQEKITAALPVFDWKTPLSSIPGLTAAPLEVEWLVNLPAIEIAKRKRRKKLNYYLHKARPTRFSLSGTTGTFTSLNLGGNGFNLRGAALAEIGLGKRFSLVFGAEYFSNDFNRKIAINEVNPLDGFPELPHNPGDALTSIQGDFNYVQIPFGIKYIIFPRRYFYPYIGTGLIAGRTSRSSLEYEYVSNPLDPLTTYSTSQGNLLPRNFELSGIYGSAGFEIQLNRNWSLLLEGGAQFDLNRGTYKYDNLQLLKLSTGLQYEF